MSIAPLHGRPARVLLVRRTTPEARASERSAERRTAPLSSRARRLRRRRLWTMALETATVLLAMAAVGWVLLRWRG